MKLNHKLLVVALAAALPLASAHAQSNADLLKQIETLKAQLEALTAKVEAVSKQAGAVNPQEFNRLVQKVDLAEESSMESGFKGLKFKGVIEAAYRNDRNSVATGFDRALRQGTSDGIRLPLCLGHFGRTKCRTQRGSRISSLRQGAPTGSDRVSTG